MPIKHVSLSGNHHILMDDSVLPALSVDWFSPDFWYARNAVTGQAQGRGTTVFIQHEQDELVLRHYKRGGLPGKLLSDQYIFAGLEATRPFKEFRLLVAMREAGLHVPEPVAVHVHRSGFIYRGDLITRKIPQSRDLHAILCESSISSALWQKVGQAVRRMQSAGVYHHDLNVRNIMVDEQQNVWIIDFDRCDFRAGESWKQNTINRFYRSLVKEQTKQAHFHWQEHEWQAFMQGLHAE